MGAISYAIPKYQSTSDGCSTVLRPLAAARYDIKTEGLSFLLLTFLSRFSYHSS
jgi:hypothetical protein